MIALIRMRNSNVLIKKSIILPYNYTWNFWRIAARCFTLGYWALQSSVWFGISSNCSYNVMFGTLPQGWDNRHTRKVQPVPDTVCTAIPLTACSMTSHHIPLLRAHGTPSVEFLTYGKNGPFLTQSSSLFFCSIACFCTQRYETPFRTKGSRNK